MWNATRVRSDLGQRLETLENRSEALDRILRQPEDSDLEEQALEVDEDGVLEGLARSIHEEIREIREALRRMDEGSYGKCRVCARRIGRRRLRVLPQSTTCVRCARTAA